MGGLHLENSDVRTKICLEMVSLVAPPFCLFPLGGEEKLSSSLCHRNRVFWSLFDIMAGDGCDSPCALWWFRFLFSFLVSRVSRSHSDYIPGAKGGSKSGGGGVKTSKNAVALFESTQCKSVFTSKKVLTCREEDTMDVAFKVFPSVIYFRCAQFAHFC